MGYTTDFWGRFDILPNLSSEHRVYLAQFAEIRHMRRDISKLPDDPIREAVGLPPGVEGEYWVGTRTKYASQATMLGTDTDDDSVIDGNQPTKAQPGLWCQWVPTNDGTALVWDEGEKFYEYEAWLAYLLDNFLTPWGYLLVGEVTWQGEDNDDQGKLVLDTNEPNKVQRWISVGHWVRT